MRKTVIGLIALAVSVAPLATPSLAQEEWPNQPLTMLVPLAPGGGVDIMARIIAERLSEQLGQRVIVENQGGAGGTIGAGTVARAEPDG